MERLLIFTFGGGRTCNQMLNCVHLLAARYASGGKLAIYNVPVQEFESLYPGLVAELSPKNSHALRLLVRTALVVSGWHPRVRRKIMERTLPALLHWILPVLGVQWIGVVNEPSKWIRGHRLTAINLREFLDEGKLRGCRRIALGGWGIRDWSTALFYRQKIAGLIRDGNPHHAAARQYLEGRRRPGARLIGVLVRQTDYRVWENGDYFYGTDEYAAAMRQLAAGRDVQFLVASDTLQSREAFAGVDVIFASGREIGSGHYMESFFELSLCDAICSPPSSFALMAAYVGEGLLLKLPARSAHVAGDLITELRIADCWHDADFKKVS